MASIDREDPAAFKAGRGMLIQYLNEAHATEDALVRTLQAHIALTPRGAYRELLEHHLEETRGHARALERRLAALGASGSLLGATIGLAESVVGQALALAKGPLDVLRGHGGDEKLLKNAKDECATEALEIATYDALEVTARTAGDEETVALARRHRAEEERMLRDLREEIPRLAEAVFEDRGGAATSAGEGRFTRDADPIPDYDSLKAAEINARLATLNSTQLRAIAERERAGRKRTSVLSRIETLLEQSNGTAARDLGAASSPA
jgi:ferritin-like metal-binding protein YciE